jgi:hypothetical protein
MYRLCPALDKAIAEWLSGVRTTLGVVDACGFFASLPFSQLPENNLLIPGRLLENKLLFPGRLPENKLLQGDQK